MLINERSPGFHSSISSQMYARFWVSVALLEFPVSEPFIVEFQCHTLLYCNFVSWNTTQVGFLQSSPCSTDSSTRRSRQSLASRTNTPDGQCCANACVFGHKWPKGQPGVVWCVYCAACNMQHATYHIDLNFTWHLTGKVKCEDLSTQVQIQVPAFHVAVRPVPSCECERAHCALRLRSLRCLCLSLFVLVLVRHPPCALQGASEKKKNKKNPHSHTGVLGMWGRFQPWWKNTKSTNFNSAIKNHLPGQE